MVCHQHLSYSKNTSSVLRHFRSTRPIITAAPWNPAVTQASPSKRAPHCRVELYSSCNATKDLIMTQQNTILGQKITYDAQDRTKVVDKSLLKMLPESSPWRTDGQLGRCTVVGNGGILKNSSCSSKINKADFVTSYPNLKKQPKPLADRMSNYGNASLIMPAFAFSFCTRISFQVHQALHSLRPQQKVVFFNPNYLRELHSYWRRRGQRGHRLSSGLMLVSVALELCEEVNLYGFWPFNFDLSQEQLPHHYYDNVGPRRGSHSMPREFLQLLNMHSKGAIKLHIGKCH